jgi:di- and tripeptidase
VFSNTGQVWSTNDFQHLYSIHSTEDVGDIFSLVYSSDLETIFCGAQDQSIQVGLSLSEFSDTPDYVNSGTILA